MKRYTLALSASMEARLEKAAKASGDDDIGLVLDRAVALLEVAIAAEAEGRAVCLLPADVLPPVATRIVGISAKRSP